MSAENVAIVKSSWAGWRQGLRAQMERDLEHGLADRMEKWAAEAGNPGLQPLEFMDGGDNILVCAAIDADQRVLWFNYTMNGPRIAGWDVYDDESQARKAAGL